MNRQPIERYGFGTRMPTRTSNMGRILLGAAALVLIVTLGVLPW